MNRVNRIISKIEFSRATINTSVALLIFGEFRRTHAVADIKNTYGASRLMLNSRAQIQIILINANLEGRRLNSEEIDRIKQLWGKAEYPNSAGEFEDNK